MLLNPSRGKHGQVNDSADDIDPLIIRVRLT